ncbi:hypothetical protein DXG01_003301, partial [Tephrocybe rancida]
DQDMIKASGPQRDIMLPDESTDDSLTGFASTFWYACILGIFHVNYVGGGVGHCTTLSPSAFPIIGPEEAEEDNRGAEDNNSDGALDMDADEGNDQDFLGFSALTSGYFLHTVEMFTLPSVILAKGLAHSAELDDCSEYAE